MEKYKWILLFLLVSLFACNKDDSKFEVSMEDLKVNFRPVSGGAMMYYSLPNNGDIFSMNIRYTDFRGEPVLKSAGYSGDSLLLDGFIKASSGVKAQLTLVNHRNEESAPQEITFNTSDSAPWAFLEDENVEVIPSWNGFQVIYQPAEVVTGMTHIFYIGINPKTQQEDTILLQSFPILASGDTLSFKLKQEKLKNTIVLRTEDFSGYRVRQRIYQDVDAYRTEQWALTIENFKDPKRKSIENEKAKTGKAYLFDGEKKGKERLIAAASHAAGGRDGVIEYGAFVAGPQAFNEPFIVDLKEKKVPAWVRLYCLYPLKANHPASNQELSYVWLGTYEDKVPCKMTVYGHPDSDNPDATGWVKLGVLDQNPSATSLKSWWSYLTTQWQLAPKDVIELESKDPVYVDIVLPSQNNTYRYLKLIVEDTFDTTVTGMNHNEYNYFTLQELEVYVKKEN